jgi:hypothetical protein
MNVLQAIQFVIKSWNEVTTETISNCWRHTGILPSTELLDDIDETDDDPILDEISKTLDALNLPNSMPAEEFLTIPDEDIVYEIPEDDHIVTELIEIFKKSANESPDDLDDDSTETVTISTNVALENLKVVHTFLLQQENANECVKLVDTIEKFIRRKQTQTTIHQYFS